MGHPVRIMDLAARLIRLSGRVPGRDIPIVIVGVRPGEKMVEEVVAPDEEQMPSDHPAIVVSQPPIPPRAAVHRALAELEQLVKDAPPSEVGDRIKTLATRGFLRPAGSDTRNSAAV
jgi:O-antigen biosynthesis protein WbqV